MFPLEALNPERKAILLISEGRYAEAAELANLERGTELPVAVLAEMAAVIASTRAPGASEEVASYAAAVVAAMALLGSGFDFVRRHADLEADYGGQAYGDYYAAVYLSGYSRGMRVVRGR